MWFAAVCSAPVKRTWLAGGHAGWQEGSHSSQLCQVFKLTHSASSQLLGLPQSCQFSLQLLWGYCFLMCANCCR